MKLFMFVTLIVAGLMSSAPASAASCAPGTRAVGSACVPFEVPENASMNFQGNGWVCNFGFQRFGDKCGPVIVPRNATMGPSGDIWACNTGFYEIRGICMPREGAVGARAASTASVDLKALRRAAAQLKAVSRERNYLTWFVCLVALTVVGMGILLVERREPSMSTDVTRISADLARPHFYRPQRVIAIENAWESWGERIDSLTGGPIEEGAAITQCPTCQASYGNESVLVLRRENRGRCLACGSRLVQRGPRTKFETVLDTRSPVRQITFGPPSGPHA